MIYAMKPHRGYLSGRQDSTDTGGNRLIRNALLAFAKYRHPVHQSNILGT